MLYYSHHSTKALLEHYIDLLFYMIFMLKKRIIISLIIFRQPKCHYHDCPKQVNNPFTQVKVEPCSGQSSESCEKLS